MRIGDFARLGQVSVRMLRHYDAIGLLVPERVDEWSNHRDYAPEQLAVLHRLIALKELGLSLNQIRELIADDPPAEQLRGMLRHRQSELASEVQVATARLAEVERRLHLIEEEEAMPTTDHIVRSLPARRIAARDATVSEGESIADVVEPLFNRVYFALSAQNACAETGVALYDTRAGEMSVTAGYDFDGSDAGSELQVIDLPEVDEAVCAVHLGPVGTIGQSWQRLHEWLDARGYVPDGPCREIYLEAGPGPEVAPERTTADDQGGWVTELQQPVRPVTSQ